MALPQDGQDANGLTKVTQIPAGKELMFIDPTTNEGGIITLEDLTKQILNGLASQAFALDAGQMTLLAALNKLNSEIRIYPQIFQLEELGSLDEFVVHLLIMVILLVTDMLALLFLKTFVQQSTQTLWIHILK